MTKEEKTTVASFFDLAGDYLAGGYRKNRTTPEFTDDPEFPARETQVEFQENVPGNSTTEPRLPLPVEPGSSETDSLEKVAADISRCSRCGLCSARINTVPGEGVPHPLVMVVGEGPGADEDATGRPFVGRAGQLLDRMLDSKGKIGLFRNRNCYIANVVKCRPPQNRNPLPDE
ncbi:MAG: uracil-DNA glycosylase, partial [Treponema sp.]|nr:uracil-DNA glycosylase [Treponema sp.]